MALIECPECGNLISEKAMKCPKCGYPIPVEMQETQNLVVPDVALLECQSKKVKINRRNRLLCIGTCSLCLIVGLCIFTIFSLRQTDKTGYYDNNKWGTSFEEIKQKYGSAIRGSTLFDDGLEIEEGDVNGIKGLDTLTMFAFGSENNLNNVTIIYKNNSIKTDSEILSGIMNEISKDYGDPERSVYEVGEVLTWETKYSEIQLMSFTTMQGSFALDFTENELSEEERTQKVNSGE